MSEEMSISERNKAIAEMLSDGKKIKDFYRFAAQNPHFDLYDACQVVIQHPDASVCFTYEEWNGMGRRITKGRKGIPYYDRDGIKHFAFDAMDTHGEERYRRLIFPMRRILIGLDYLNGTEQAGDTIHDYRKIYAGVEQYLQEHDYLSDDDVRNKILCEGVSFSLYSKTGFPKTNGIKLHGMPYGLQENADLFKEVFILTETVKEEIEDAYFSAQEEVPVINDIDEETISDEPIIKTEPVNEDIPQEPEPVKEPIKQKEEMHVSPYYQRFLDAQEENPDSVIVQRLGDFYEVMGDNAVRLADRLNMTLTGRDVGLEERVPMIGFPYHAVDAYLVKILEEQSIVLFEEGKEPIYLPSHKEVLGEEEVAQTDKLELKEMDDDEPNPFDDAQEETDGYGEEDDELDEEPDDEFDEGYDEDEQDEPEEKQPQEKKKGKPIWERRNKPSRQKSFFDEIEQKTPEEELTEHILKGGSNVSGGKIRIYDEYQKNPYEQDFVSFIRKEYGIGGRGGPDGIDEMHDGKGIRFSKKNKETGETISVSLKWEQAAVKIANLIDEGNYLNEEEMKEYETLVRFRNERKSANGDDELVKVMARQIVEYGTAHTYSERYSDYPGFLDEGLIFYSQHTEEIIKEVEKYDEVVSVANTNYPYLCVSFKLPYCPVWKAREERIRQREEKVKDYVDRFTRQCADEYEPSNEKNVVMTVAADDLPENEFLFLKDYREEFTKYCLKQKGVENVELSMKKIEITFDRRYIESLIAGNEQTPEERGRIRKIANGIISEGIRESTEGNYCAFFDELKENEEFARVHSKEIVEELCRREEVSDVEMTDDGFDVNYYTQYLWNYKDEPESGEETTREPEQQGQETVTSFNRFKELTEPDRTFAEEFFSKNLSEPYDSPWGEVQSCTVIKNGIYFVSTASHGGIMIPQILAPHILSAEALSEGCIEQGYYCYEEDADKNVPLRELYDKGILTRDNDYFTSSYVNTDRPDMKGRYIQFSELTDEEKEKFYEDWDKILNESLAHWNTKYWQAHESVETNTTIVQDLDEEEDAEWDRRIVSGEIKPVENNNTDLTEIGFDQGELGGAKARFKSNIDAIETVKKLYRENREATPAERKILAKYVGWGGLAKAFDETDENWQKEYTQLKGLLTEDEYNGAKGSVLNAHYTAKEVIDGMYYALKRFGVKGNNRILEPALGTGNFFGFMPKEISDGAKLYGVELDSLTGRIASKLYPQANVQIKGFEQTSFTNDSFDIVVTNVPFGAYSVYDSEYSKHNFYIHDYFIAKSIDKLKPNGLMAVITSKGTMDKLNPSVRKYFADRAELLGAIRLPNNAFKATANTEVVADVLFFRKREEQINADTQNTEWLATGKTEQGYEINNYFIKHPEMVLGTLVEERGLYGAMDVTVKPDSRELSVAFNEAVERLPADFYTNPEKSTTIDAREEIEVDYDVKPLCYKTVGNRLYMRVGDTMEEREVPIRPQDAFQRISGMIDLRKTIREILEMEISGCSDEQLQFAQKRLNDKYDRFVRNYGILNSQTNIRLFREDADSSLLFECEKLSDDKKTATKADVFFERTIRPYVVPTQTDDCFEALQISLNERGRVDIAYIEELTKKDYDTVLTELGNTVFRNPAETRLDDDYSGFETAEKYLSGNVKRKLSMAKTFAREFPDKGFDRNVKALEDVQPEPLSASDISVRIGASWIDKDYYKQFLMKIIGIPFYYEDGLSIYYNPHDSSWRVDKSTHLRHFSDMKVHEVYGTSRASAYRIFEDCLNLKATTIYDTVEEDGREKRVLNQAETIAAREKQNKIKEEFKDWIFENPERRDELVARYNELFNQIRLPAYDGSYLKFPEMNPAIELKPHQKNAVQRIVTGENTLLHHVVGAGKTFTICAACMKLRQYGLAKKPMIAVPNHLVQQWAGEFRKLYPNAKLLIAGKEDLEKNNRKRFVSKVALGDWDAVIIAQSSFAKIPISAERQERKLQEEISRIEETIASQWEENSHPRGAVKNLERIKKSREAQLKKLMDDAKKDDVLIFENLGVDYLFIDEAHNYKNLFLFTKMNNVAGISTTASQRASDLKLKVEFINELHGGDKGVVFATGTPISNSMTEMYTMQSYLGNETLNNIGINFFDAWAADFGETITSLEMAPSGQGYKAKTRFAKFTNLPELLTLYRSFADVQTSDMVKLDVPEVDREVIALKPSDTVIDLAEEIAERAEKISYGKVPPEIDNMLKITSDGKKLALDPRCFEPTAGDEETSKLNACAERIYEIWNDTQDFKGTQIVFCDLSTPKKAFEDYEYGKDFDVYNDLKYKLVQKGIPANEIEFIHEANTDAQKQALFDNVNDGKVRVLLGSTEKCGAGTNVQKRLVALHHLDTPYRPSDMEQREGRIVRQGNENERVKIFTYVTERTFDSYSYQILENKQRFISQINKGDLTVREAEDIDETTLSYAEIKAITAANPKIKRKMEVDTEVARLRVLEGQFKKNLYALQDKIRKTFPEDIRRQELFIERTRADMKVVEENYNPDNFVINVNGIVFTDRKEGSRALMDALYESKPETVVAEYAGFKISMNPMVFLAGERSITLSCNGQYSIDIGQSASGNLTRIENFLEDLPNREQRLVSRLEQLKLDYAVAQEEVKKPFEHAELLTSLLKEQTELNAELDLNKHEEVIISDDKDEGDNYMALPESNNTSGQKFIREEKRIIEEIENMEMAVQPDYSIDQEDMANYGYVWRGMLPMSRETAEQLYKLGLPVHRLHEDGTEYAINKPEDFHNERIFGIKKTDWKPFIESEIGKTYLATKFEICNAASDVVSEDLGYVDEAFTIDFMESNYAERAALKNYTKGIKPDKRYVPGLIDEYTDKIYDDALKHYGWVKSDITKAIVNRIDNAELKDETENDVKQSELQEFVRQGLIDHNLHEVVIGEVTDEDDAYEIATELKSWFEDSSFTEGTSGEEFDYWYDDFSEETIIPLLMGRHYNAEDELYEAVTKDMNTNEFREFAGLEPIDYKKRVMELVNDEFRQFQTATLAKTPEEIFSKNYEIYVKTELMDTIIGEGIGDEYYQALYQDRDNGILQQLYDDFIGSEYASVNTGTDTMEFIQNYCYQYYGDVLKSERETPTDGDVLFFGTDFQNTAYYYFKDKLGGDYDELRITEEAKRYIISAPVCYLSQEYMDEHNIIFLKTGRDIDEDKLSKDFEYGTREEMKKAYYLKLPLESVEPNKACKTSVEGYIRGNFDGMRLKTENISGLVDYYGEERLNFVLANTVQMSETDGRYSLGNKAWASGIVVLNDESDRAKFYINSHPAILDGFISSYRKQQKEKADRREKINRFEIETEFGGKETVRATVELYNVKEPLENRDVHGLAIHLWDETGEPYATLTTSFGEFIGQKNCAYVDVNNCPFAEQLLKQGLALDTGLEYQSGYVTYPLWQFNEEFLKTVGGEDYKTYSREWDKYMAEISEQENNEKEENILPENENKNKWVTVKVSHNACLSEQEKHLFMKMPNGSEYRGYTYNVYKSRVKESSQLVDLQSDSSELCYELLFRDNEYVILHKGDDEVELSAEEFKEIVNGTSDKDYVREEPKERLSISIPGDNIKGTYEKSSLISIPDDKQYAGYGYYVPNSFIEEDKSREDGYMKVSLPEDIIVTLKNKERTEEMTVTAKELKDIYDGKKVELTVSKTQETKVEEQKNDGGWKNVYVPANMFIKDYEKSNLMRMPDGKYSGYVYYFPKNLMEETRKGDFKLSLPENFTIRLKNNKDGGEYELSVDEFIAEVSGKKTETYQKPSETKSDKFSERKKVLDEKIPQEMKDKPNWVIVRVSDNPEKGRPNKYLINVHTGKFAESDNPETWTDYETACEYARSNGGITLAYALDGKDGIACIDLDHCIDEDGNYSELAKEVLSKCGKTYVETSVSGKGLHIFGKTEGMDVRAFSKDGDFEFYQKSHFIAMTGDNVTDIRFESFDSDKMKELITRKCEKRSPWSGKGAGVEGLSKMSDRDVVEKACADKKHGETFKSLYNGQDLFNNHSNSDMSLMNRLAYWCNGDKEQMLRIFATSGLFRPEKSPDYYEGTAIKAIRDVNGRFHQNSQNTYKPKPPVNTSGNSKR